MRKIIKRTNSKVLVSAYACNPAGDPRLHPGEDLVGWKLVQELSKSHELWIITHDYNRPEIKKSNSSAHPENVHFVFVKLPSFIRNLYRIGFGERVYYYLWQIAAWRTAVRLHRQQRFDLAHHLTFGNFWMPSFIGAFLPVPFIWGPIGGGQKVPRVFFKDYSLLEKLSEWGRDAAQWVGRNLLVSRRICMRRASLILVCNRETKAKFPRKYWPKIQYFPVNGISPDELAKEAKPVGKRSGLKVITAGRLIRLKAFDIVLKAFAQVAKQDSRASLNLIGQGPEQNALRELASDLGLKNRVTFVPWLSRRDLLRNMRLSDVFAFASLRDGGGAVVVEAMASGIPVVCLNVGGPGFHTSGEWGIKIYVGDSDMVAAEMARSLIKLGLDPELRRRLGWNGRKRAEAYYLWEKQGERLRDFYRQILGKKETEVAGRPA